MPMGVWKSAGGSEQPERLLGAALGLERRLQHWIAADPAIVEQGLAVVGYEVRTPRGRIDILAVDPQDELVVIELKGEKLTRDVIAQTLDYIVVLEMMDPKDIAVAAGASLRNEKTPGVLKDSARDLEPVKRTVRGIAVGVGEREDLTRISEYLQARAVPIRHLSFEMFRSGADEYLVRHVEPEVTRGPSANAPTRIVSPAADPADLFSTPKLVPFQAELERIAELADDLQIHKRYYSRSVMFSPAQNKTRMLFTIKDQGFMYFSADTFNEFYGADPEVVLGVVGPLREGDWRQLEPGLLDRIGEALPSWIDGAFAEAD